VFSAFNVSIDIIEFGEINVPNKLVLFDLMTRKLTKLYSQIE